MHRIVEAELRAQAAHPLHDRGECVARCLRRRAQGIGVPEVRLEPGGPEDRLGGDAARREAVPSHEVALDERDAGAELGGRGRRDEAGRFPLRSRRAGSAGRARGFSTRADGRSRAASCRARPPGIPVVRSRHRGPLYRASREPPSPRASHPSTSKARAAQAGDERFALSKQAPDEARALVLEHEEQRPLLDSERRRGDPEAGAALGVLERRIEAPQPAPFVQDLRVGLEESPVIGLRKDKLGA